MKQLNARMQTMLENHQVALIWFGILIVLLLIILIMLSWVTMLKVSLLEENTSVSTTRDTTPVSTDEPPLTPEEQKAAVAQTLSAHRNTLLDSEKNDIYTSRLNVTDKPTATDEQKAAVVNRLNNQ